MIEKPSFLTSKQAAEYLGYSENTLRECRVNNLYLQLVNPISNISSRKVWFDLNLRIKKIVATVFLRKVKIFPIRILCAE